MLISEAVKEAIKTGGKITRKDFQGHLFKPTNTPDGVIILAPKSKKPHSKRWQPCADDLMAEDWEVVDKQWESEIKSIYETTEISGIGCPHVVQMFFELPYPDWCKFEKSKVFHQLVSYLKELEKTSSRQHFQEAQD